MTRFSCLVAGSLAFAAVCISVRPAPAAEDKAPSAASWNMDLPDNVPPPGFMVLFDGKDLTNWKGLVSPQGGPPARAKMTPDQLSEAQKKADQVMRDHWSVVDGILHYDGKGQSLCTAKDYSDMEMWVDWKITPNGDSGIYLRGTPQVQIWDPFNTKNAAVGSGGLYNNKKNPHDPLVKADRPIGQWNRFFIRMVGEKVTVYFNEKLVVDNVVLENYWEPSKPIYPKGQIELQNHTSPLFFKNIYLRELKND